MDFTNKTTAFVYGTLMQGFWNERVIDAFPHENYSAVINNMELYDVGSFPAMIKGDHSYVGELLVFDDDVDTDALYMNMDRLEGYNKNNPESSLYRREKVTVYVNNKPVETEAYLWNCSLDRLKYIDSEKFSGYKEYIYSLDYR